MNDENQYKPPCFYSEGEERKETLEDRYNLYVTQMELLKLTPKDFDEWLNS